MNERIESIHKDCRFYMHDSILVRTCCGGKHILGEVEMILCEGKKTASTTCKGCVKYKKKEI